MTRLDIETVAQNEEGGVSLNTDETKLFLSFLCKPIATPSNLLRLIYIYVEVINGNFSIFIWFD
jgi:hypothetical protein